MTDDVALPKAIQEELEQAEEIQKMLLGEEQGEAAAEASSAGQDVSPQGNEPEHLVEQPRQETPPERPREETVEYWREKYRTLEGKYNAEVPRLHDQTKELTERISLLTQQLMHLQAQLEERKGGSEPEKEEPAAFVTDEDRDLHGDVVDLAMRAAKQVIHEMGLVRLAGRLAQLDERLGRLEQVAETVAGSQAKTAQQTLVQALKERVPDVEEINQSSEFAEWINKVDPIAGRTRMELAQEAAAALDVDRLVAIFEAFKRETGWGQQNKPAAQPQPSPELEKMQEPPRVNAASSDADLTDAKRVWTESEYNRVYDPRFIKEVGEKRAAQLQELADRAVREGRIRWGA